MTKARQGSGCPTTFKVLLFFLLAAGLTRAQDANHDFARWEEFLAEKLRGKCAGGYAFVVMQDAKIVASGAEGYARAPWEEMDPGVPWTLDKQMPIASISKTVTALALLTLQAQKKFSLDAPFWPFVKESLPDVHASVKAITLRQLLVHRSGLEKSFWSRETREAVLAHEAKSPPGTKYFYNNGNFYLLRLVIEAVSGENYTPYVQRRVLKKLGIRTMDTRAERERPTLAYSKLELKQPGWLWTEDFTPRAGGEGWWGSVADVAKILSAVRRHKLFSRDKTDAMLREKLGWHYVFADDVLVGYFHNGIWMQGDSVRNGQVSCDMIHFCDGVDAVLFINSNDGDAHALQVEAWRQSRKELQPQSAQRTQR